LVVCPELFDRPTALKLAVELWGQDQGALFRAKEGRDVDVVMGFRNGPAEFCKFVLRALRRLDYDVHPDGVVV